jgi:hypothetical protein
MTTTPILDDLAPPDELVRKLTVCTGLSFDEGLDRVAVAARWGWERGRQLWPEPISDRPPTFDDGDEEGYIQVFSRVAMCSDSGETTTDSPGSTPPAGSLGSHRLQTHWRRSSEKLGVCLAPTSIHWTLPNQC